MVLWSWLNFFFICFLFLLYFSTFTLSLFILLVYLLKVNLCFCLFVIFRKKTEGNKKLNKRQKIIQFMVKRLTISLIIFGHFDQSAFCPLFILRFFDIRSFAIESNITEYLYIIFCFYVYIFIKISKIMCIIYVLLTRANKSTFVIIIGYVCLYFFMLNSLKIGISRTTFFFPYFCI